MAEPDEFYALLGHDASSTIRGFFYQINLTILHWLELPVGHYLELEAGEDIDEIGGIFSEGEKRSRALKQIKDLRKNITLRSPEVLAPLARFFTHQRLNPRFELEFFYITTASVGKEQASACGEPLLVYWAELQNSSRPTNDPCFHQLRHTVGTAPLPDGILADDWTEFKLFFSSADPDKVVAFASQVRWLVRQPDSHSLKSKIEGVLVDRSLCSTSQAGLAYAQLVLHVTNLLSGSGGKRLGRDDVGSVLKDFSAQKAALDVVLKLEAMTAAVQAQSELLEEDIKPVLSGIDAGVKKLISQNWASDKYSSVVDVSVDPPEAVTRSVSRESAVLSLLKEVEAHAWVAVSGTGTSGKTQLVLQGCRSSKRQPSWVSLKGRSAADALAHVGRCLSTIAQRPISPLIRADLREACSRLPAKGVIVLDDLPESDRTERLEEALALLGGVCVELGVRVITTATGRLPQYLRDRIPDLSEITVPPFEAEETKSLFSLFHAPDEYLKPWFIEYVGVIVHKNPLLLRAAAQHCEGIGWPLPPVQVLGDLLGNRFGENVNDETLRLLNATIADETTKEFLYRLQVVGFRFTVDDALAVASVSPQVSRVQERLAMLNGIWVEKDSRDEYLLSPRVSRLPKGNLTTDIERRVHLAIASAVVRKGTLNQLDVVKGVTHYIGAGEPESALSLLLMALRALAASSGANIDDWLITSIWYDTELPQEFDADDRAELRVAQVLAREKLGKDVSSAIRDLQGLVGQPDQISPTAFIPAALTVSIRLMFEKPGYTTRLLREAINLLGSSQADEIPRSLRLTAAQMLWGPAAYSQTNEEAFAWLETALDLGDEDLRSLCAADIAYVGAQRICDGLWIRQSDLDETARDWQGMLERLTALTDRAIRLNAAPLIAALVRARIIVSMDFLGDIVAAEAVAEHGVSLLRSMPAAEFLVSSTIGQQYYFKDLLDSAQRWLDRAIELETAGVAMQRVYALLYGGTVKAASSQEASLKLIERAVAIAAAAPDIPGSLAVRSIGEKAMALWLVHGIVAAYESIREAADILLKLDLSEKKEQSLFFLFGSALGYFIQVAAGHISSTPSAQLVVPKPGMFLDFSSRFAVLFKAEHVGFMMIQMAIFAQELGSLSDSSHFAGMALAQPDVSPKMRLLVFQSTVEQRAVERDYPGIMDEWRAITADPLPEDAPPTVLQSLMEIPVIAIAFSIADAALVDASAGKETALEAVQALSGLSGSVAAADDFHLAAAFIQQAFVSDSPAVELVGLANRQTKTAFHVVLYLGALFKVPPTEALRATAAILPVLSRLGGVYRFLVVPFIRRYWQLSFERNRFAYSMPRVIEGEIAGALARDGRAGVKPLLSAIARGLGVSLADDVLNRM